MTAEEFARMHVGKRCRTRGTEGVVVGFNDCLVVVNFDDAEFQWLCANHSKITLLMPSKYGWTVSPSDIEILYPEQPVQEVREPVAVRVVRDAMCSRCGRGAPEGFNCIGCNEPVCYKCAKKQGCGMCDDVGYQANSRLRKVLDSRSRSR
jgi:hypothetical protein